MVFFSFGWSRSSQGATKEHLCVSDQIRSLTPSLYQLTTKNSETPKKHHTHQEFFSAFFSLSEKNWTGFLSSRLGFGELIAFGLSLFAKSSNAARADLLIKGLPGLVVMLAQLATMKAVRSEKR